MNGFDPNAAADPSAGVFGLPHRPEDAGVVLVPVPWEATTSYRPGTARGPSAILAASHQVDLFDVETGAPYRAGIAMLDEADEVRAWNAEARALAEQVIAVGGEIGDDPALRDALARVNARSEQVNAWVERSSETWLEAGKLVGVVGGEHSVPFGLIAALARRHPGLGVLHLDAHADLRNAYEGFAWSHASIMHNVLARLPGVGRLVQVGIRDLCEAEVELIDAAKGRVVTWFDAALAARRFGGESWASLCEAIVRDLPSQVYVSFDVDGLDPALCPHTGTPVPGGLSFAEASFLVGAVARSGRRIVGFDLNEVAPGPDEWDANVGARMLYKLIGWSLISRGTLPMPAVPAPRGRAP